MFGKVKKLARQVQALAIQLDALKYQIDVKEAINEASKKPVKTTVKKK